MKQNTIFTTETPRHREGKKQDGMIDRINAKMQRKPRLNPLDCLSHLICLKLLWSLLSTIGAKHNQNPL